MCKDLFPPSLKPAAGNRKAKAPPLFVDFTPPRNAHTRVPSSFGTMLCCGFDLQNSAPFCSPRSSARPDTTSCLKVPGNYEARPEHPSLLAEFQKPLWMCYSPSCQSFPQGSKYPKYKAPTQNSTQRLECSSFWAVYYNPYKRKIGHSQKGITSEPLGSFRFGICRNPYIPYVGVRRPGGWNPKRDTMAQRLETQPKRYVFYILSGMQLGNHGIYFP